MIHITQSRQLLCIHHFRKHLSLYHIIRILFSYEKRSYSNRSYVKDKDSEESVDREELMKQLNSHYGIITAKICKLPDEVILYSQSLLPKLRIKTILWDCIISSN